MMILSVLHHLAPESSSPTGNESPIIKERLFAICLVCFECYFGLHMMFKRLKPWEYVGEIPDLWTKISGKKKAEEHLSGLKTHSSSLSLQDAACLESWGHCVLTLTSQETRARARGEEIGLGVGEARWCWPGPLGCSFTVCLSVFVNGRHVEWTLASLTLLVSLIFVPALLFVSLCLQGPF